jgi:TetR/AcrR family transcriptional regulator, transcriptional repressor for nem operon
MIVLLQAIMPRQKLLTRDVVLERALGHFWSNGFASSSMDDLVTATRASRHAIYSEFGSKDGLFEAVLGLYVNVVVTPAFAPVEGQGAGLAGAGLPYRQHGFRTRFPQARI